MKHVMLFEQHSSSAPWARLNALAEKRFGEFGFASLSEEEMAKLIHLKRAEALALKLHGEEGFATLSEEEMEDLINSHPELLKK